MLYIVADTGLKGYEGGGFLGYRWSDFVYNEWWLRETQMRFVTCIVCERRLRMYGHVALFLKLMLLTRFSQQEANGPTTRHVVAAV